MDFSVMVGGMGECRSKSCGWKGPREELVAVPFKHPFMTDESVMLQFTQELRQLLARDIGVVLLRYLVKWGFVRTVQVKGVPQVDAKQFTRYLVVIARAIIVAVLEERNQQETAPQEVLTKGPANDRAS